MDLTGEKDLTITVMDKDMAFDDLVGSTNIMLDDLFQRKKILNWYPLEYKNKKAGDILLELEFFPSQSSSSQAPLHQIPAT